MEAKQKDVCSANTSWMNSFKKKNAGDRLCHSKRKLLVKEVKKRAEWQDMLNVSQIAQCSTSHCKWHQKGWGGIREHSVLYAWQELQASRSGLLKVTNLLQGYTAAFNHIYKSCFLSGMRYLKMSKDKQQSIRGCVHGHLARPLSTTVTPYRHTRPFALCFVCLCFCLSFTD